MAKAPPPPKPPKLPPPTTLEVCECAPFSGRRCVLTAVAVIVVLVFMCAVCTVAGNVIGFSDAICHMR